MVRNNRIGSKELDHKHGGSSPHRVGSTLSRSFQSEIQERLSRWLIRLALRVGGMDPAVVGDLNPEMDLEPGDLDGLIQRFLHLKEVASPDLDGSFQDEDELFKGTAQNTSACDYQWFNDELGFGTFDENETGSPLCIGINTDCDVANIDMEVPFKISAEEDKAEAARCERIASITGSILQQLEAYPDSVTSGPESADLNNSMEMSICKSENLFSPLNDNQPDIPALSTFSTDSLDVRSDILATCAATNHNNYTIAFNGNNILEESYNTLSSAYRTANGTTPTTTSDRINENSPGYISPWKVMTPGHGHGHGHEHHNSKLISNNNGSSNSSASSQWTVDNTSHLFTQSCPNAKVLWTKRRIFDLGARRNQLYNRNNSDFSENTSRSRETSTDGSSNPSSDESHYHRTRLERAKPTTTAQLAEIIKKSIQIQTSYSACPKMAPPKIGVSQSTPVYICYPNYTLPDLNFLSEKNRDKGKKDVYLMPQQYKVPLREKRAYSAGYSRSKRPMSCNDMEELRHQDLSHIRDWPSLHFLLPDEYRTILKDMNMKYEENNEDEKSSEVGMGLDGSPVVMRKKLNNVTKPMTAEKRYSLNMGAGHGKVSSSRRFSKRFSLQEPIIPEINEITNEINKNLRVLNEMEADLFQLPPTADGNSSDGLGPGPGPPQNTPKISFIENHQGAAAGAVTAAATLRTIQNSATRMSRMAPPKLTEKQELTEAISTGVTEIQNLCKLPSGRSPLSLGINSKSPAGKCVLDMLCPSLYSLLSDGLCPFLDTIFGKIPNTVWRVIEASIQYGPTAQPLNELVMKINSEESLAEGPMKFNAFICGLLNLGNLSSWLLFLRTKERLLRTHYHPTGLMFLCNTSTRSLYDQMVEVINYLTKLPFQLDIFHEVKVLHQSIQSNKAKLRTGGVRSSSASLPSHRKHSQIDSNKLTHEQQIGRASYATSKNSKYYVNQLKKTQMKRSFSDERPNPSKVPIGTSIPKSKTSQNINAEKYASAPKLTSKHSKQVTSRRGSVDYEATNARILRVKDQEKGIEPTKKPPRPKSLGNPTQLLQMEEFSKEQRTGSGEKDPEKFRNLRLQWELLTSDEVKGRGAGLGSPGSTTGGNLIGSKIPRPISSPIKTNTNHFPTGNLKTNKR